MSSPPTRDSNTHSHHTSTPAGNASALQAAGLGEKKASHTALAAIHLCDLHKHFGSVRAVQGVNLTIRPGEVVAFLGPNGAGKTTTIDMILGLSRPSTGQVEVYGLSPEQAASRGLVSAVMQNGGLLKDFTVEETVRYISKLFSASRPVAEVLERAGIAGIAGRMVSKCSGGEQQRLRFAMALLPDPDLLILDEPTQGMDVEGRRDFWNAIRKDAAKGRTILFATHYLEEADAYADRIILIRRGEIVADGTAAEVKAMASGRTLRATLAGADATSLKGIPGVEEVKLQGDTVIINSADTDSVARYLLNETDARDLEITARGLEDAFLALTGDEAHDIGTAPTPRGAR
ncbi:MAG: ABC transporter ATP-binding protein [Actinomycetota bacterium]|jgi:ABC-2 type transport system ATP-binding protein|nr:ABC transporter ATP-binding protein [Actinomycetota bacterium]